MSAEPEDAGILEYLRRAFQHGEEAVRAYLALLGADIERRYSRVLRRSIEMLGLIGVGIVAVALLATGIARMIEAHLDVPGSGQVIIGGALVLIVAIGFFALRGREGK